MAPPILFIEEAPEFEPHNGNVLVTMISGEHRQTFLLTRHAFYQTIVEAQRARGLMPIEGNFKPAVDIKTAPKRRQKREA